MSRTFKNGNVIILIWCSVRCAHGYCEESHGSDLQTVTWTPKLNSYYHVTTRDTGHRKKYNSFDKMLYYGEKTYWWWEDILMSHI